MAKRSMHHTAGNAGAPAPVAPATTPAAPPATTPAAPPANAAPATGAPAAAAAAPTAATYAAAVAQATGGYAPHPAKHGVALAAVVLAWGPGCNAGNAYNPKVGASRARWAGVVATMQAAATAGTPVTMAAWLAAGHTMPDLLWGLAPNRRGGALLVVA